MATHSRNRLQIASALALVTKFSAGRKLLDSGAWKNIGDKLILQPLKERILNPKKIRQRDTNTCGPAAFVYALAYYRPDQYAELILDLHRKGEATLGTIIFKPDDAARNAWDPKATSIAAVDWIAIAGVKNTTSSSYDEPVDAAAGITMPSEVGK